MEGPDYLALFTGMKCLNGEANEADIVRHLRFFKDDGNYQTFLRHYLPMLSEEKFKEFIEDVKDEVLKAELLKRFIPEVPEVKKVGRPAKVLDSIPPTL